VVSDRDRLRAVAEANSRALFAYLARRVADREDAADLLSETLLATWRRLRDLPADDEAARMWMFGIARRVLANHHRGRRRRAALAEGLRSALSAAPPLDPAPLAHSVQAAIAALPGELTEIVRLIHWDGFSQAEVAGLLGIPASTVRGRYARARVLLRERLSEEDAEPVPRAGALLTGR
jgi:RNA polymerase sigma-70 factor (ECF subfamily)